MDCLRGLMGRYQLDQAEGLLLVEARDTPHRHVHPYAVVYMDLAVIWINSGYTVVDTFLAPLLATAYAPRRQPGISWRIHPNRLSEFHIGIRCESKMCKRIAACVWLSS